MSPPTIIAIWKPKGPTSHDVVDVVRRITGERRVGHAGTLDPMAEGVLVIGIGREATRELHAVVDSGKEYIATIQLGATSTTDDAEGEITPFVSLRGSKATEAISSDATGEVATRHAAARGCASLGCLARDAIEKVLHHFLGRIEQVPPAYSAVKVRGKPAHRRMRAGEHVRLEPRTIEIKEIELLEYTPPTLRVESQISNLKFQISLRIVCGPGTYIRALARDIGRALGVGGYLTRLERTRVGTYTKANALTLDEFRNRWPQIAASR